MPRHWPGMHGSWRGVGLAEAVDRLEGDSRDCRHLAATAVGRYRDAVMVVAAAAVVAGVEEGRHEWDCS